MRYLIAQRIAWMPLSYDGEPRRGFIRFGDIGEHALYVYLYEPFSDREGKKPGFL